MTKDSPTPTFNPYAIYDVNEDFEVDGVWLTDPFHRIKIARAGGRNTKFLSVHEAITKNYKRAIQLGTLPKDIDLGLSHTLYARAVVREWAVAEIEFDAKGRPVVKKDAKGNPIWKNGYIHDPVTFEVKSVNEDLIVATFVAKPELYSYVVSMANNVTTFRDEDAEAADVKN